MQRVRRRNPRLQEKLESLQREIARVEKDIKGISQAIDSPDPDRVVRRLRKAGEVPPAEPINWPTSPEPTRTGNAEQSAMANPLYGGGEDVVMPKPVPDQRFQTYFGTGSLHSVRPLRQERRVQRNKAIFMLILALALVYLVIDRIF